MLWDLRFLNELKTNLSEDENRLATQQQRLFTIILNRPLPKITDQTVRRSDIVICADGGANHLVDEIIKPAKNDFAIQNLRSFQKGQFLTLGDLDSLRPDVSTVYHTFLIIDVLCVIRQSSFLKIMMFL